MDEFFSLVIFIIVLWSILGGARAKKKGGPVQRPRQPPRPPARPAEERAPARPRPQYRRPHGTTAPGDAGQPEQAAGTMVPEELWQILTGEKPPWARPSPAPAPSPRPAPRAPESEGWEEEAEVVEAEAGRTLEGVSAEDEEVAAVLRRREVRDDRSLEQLPPRPEPVVVSLETPTAAEARHAAFHEEVERGEPAVVIRRARPIPLGLAARSDLRRAVILREVLGPPKALQ
ncbi:MAG: hypothetical protein HY561_08745 [Gemmatimonadetes bacterium]|nr:hypothetical protein [Gemmatimonadota bacterium]